MDADAAPQAYSTVRISRGDKTVRISLDDLEVRNSIFGHKQTVATSDYF